MNKRFIPLLILGATIAFFVIGMSRSGSDDVQEKEVQSMATVKTAPAVREELQESLLVMGVVKGEDEIALAPKVPGRVAKIHVTVGDTVSKGQLLATIDGAEIHAQTQVAAVGAQAAADASKNTEKYFDQIVDEAKSGRDSTEDAYKAAKDIGDDQLIAQTKASYDAAKEATSSAKRMRDLQIEGASGQSAVAQQQLVAAQTYASNTQIHAPFGGVVIAQHFDQGSLVAPQSPLFTLAKSQTREVEIAVPADVLPYVAVGDTVTLRYGVTKIGDTPTENDNKPFSGTVSAVSPMVDTQTRKGLVVVSLSESSHNIGLGEYVDVSVPQSDARKTLMMPQKALISTYYDTFVFVEKDGEVAKRMITTGSVDGVVIEILAGVEEGENVVVEGQYNISDGDVVDVYGE